MDTRDLAVFVKVYEAKGITQAAKELYLSPQGASRIIHRLEAELETSLFGRYYFGVRPTPQADVLYANAQKIMELLSEAKGSVNQQTAEKRVLSIASTQGISEYLSLAFSRDFMAANPFISLRIIESSDAVAKARLDKQEAELAILGGPIDLSRFHCMPFTQHRPCIVVHTDNPLARRRAIAYEDLDSQPIAIMSREFASTCMIANKLAAEGVHPDVVVEANEINLCHLLAAQGEVIAISFDFAAWGNPRENTVILPFEDSSFVWETFLVWRANSKLSSAALDFRYFSVTWLKEHVSRLFHWPAHPQANPCP